MSDEFENNDRPYEGQDGLTEQFDDAPQDVSDADGASVEQGDASDYSYDDEPYDDDGQYDGDSGDAYYDDAPKQPAKMKREWANSITTNKKVKREEMRRKLKKAMLFMLVFALIVTSIVYIMLLFIQENNVRITASSQNRDNSIALSFDNNYWTPYLNAQGPTKIWDVSYSPIYKREKLDTIDAVTAMLRGNDVPVGTNNGENFIRFTFMLRNNGSADVNVDYEMTLENDRDSGLQNAVRVMWGESFKNPENVDDEFADDPNRTAVRVYAALSNDARLASTGLNVMREPEDGYLEYVAYPSGSDAPGYNWRRDFQEKLDTPDGMTTSEAMINGFLEPTIAFAGTDVVFRESTLLPRGDIMYCYVCIWLEGSDFDCNDKALGGYVRLGINFVATSIG